MRRQNSEGRAESATATIEALAHEAEQGSREHRQRAVRAIGARRDRQAVSVLAWLLGDSDDEHVRVDAARALAMCGGPEAVLALRRAARRGSSVLRAEVAEALAILGDPSSLPELSNLTDYPSAPVRAATARALGQIGDAGAVEELARLVEDSDGAVRRRARHALALIGTPQALSILQTRGRRLTLFRWADVRTARRSAEKAAHRGEIDSVDRFWVTLVAAGAGLALTAFAVVAVDIVILGATSWVVAAATALSVLTLVVARTVVSNDLTLLPAARMSDVLDTASGRREPLPAIANRATQRRSMIRWSVPRRAAVWALVCGALVLDAPLRGPGIFPGIVAGLLLAGTDSYLREARTVRRWEAGTGSRLWTEGIVGPLATRRYFTD